MGIYSNAAGSMGEWQAIHKNLLSPLTVSQLLTLGRRTKITWEIGKGVCQMGRSQETQAGDFQRPAGMQRLRSSKGWAHAKGWLLGFCNKIVNFSILIGSSGIERMGLISR